MEMIRAVIAEDHQLVREGIRALLEKAGNIEVVGEASNGQEAVMLAMKLEPDVLIMDIMMPIMNGIQAAESIQEMNLQVRILLLSMYSDPGLVYQALQYGVNGYVLKSSVSEELIWAVRAVSNGEIYLSSPISDILIERALDPQASPQEEDPLSSLSPREKMVVQLIAEGHTSAEIAEILSLSHKTVEKHRSNLMEKLNIHNIAGLVRFAIKYRLIDRDS